MLYFQTKNPNLRKFWTALQWMMLVYFEDIRSILMPSGIFKKKHLVYFLLIWSHFPRLDMLYKEKSGNPDHSDVVSNMIL
jgi:hypothetical protein